MGKLLYLGNFAWSLSVYRKLEMIFQNEFEEIEIWIADISKYTASPFLSVNYNFHNATTKVMSKGDLKIARNYEEANLLIACGFPYRIPIEFLRQDNILGINLHPSLLPRFWGPDPIRNQILKNDNNYGVSLQLIGENFDTGLVIEQGRLVRTNEACMYEILYDLSFVAVKLVESFLKNKKPYRYKKFKSSKDCLLLEDNYAGSVHIESYKNNPYLTSRLIGTEKWLKKLLQNGK